MARERWTGEKGGRARLEIWPAVKSKKEMGEEMERKRMCGARN